MTARSNDTPRPRSRIPRYLGAGALLLAATWWLSRSPEPPDASSEPVTRPTAARPPAPMIEARRIEPHVAPARSTKPPEASLLPAPVTAPADTDDAEVATAQAELDEHHRLLENELGEALPRVIVGGQSPDLPTVELSEAMRNRRHVGARAAIP